MYDPMRPSEHFDKPGKSPFMTCNCAQMPRAPRWVSAVGVIAATAESKPQYWYDPSARPSISTNRASPHSWDMQLGSQVRERRSAGQHRGRLARSFKTSGFVLRK